MKCSHCGASNPDAAKYCYKCGKALTDEALTTDRSKMQRIQQPVGEADFPHSDPVCPYCGSHQCEPVSRTIANVHGKGYSISDGCCGLCLLGPFGLLCGLCGSGTNVDLKNELVWVCKSCGKEHLSQKDALEKAQVLAFSYVMSILFIAVVLSTWHTGGNLHWLFLLIWVASPVIGLQMIDDEISKTLGYPMAEILPPGFHVKTYLMIVEVVTVLVLIFSGSIVCNILAEL
nr:zinc-ribbon domain-containing protein [uncultured Oscillibacter sp.]